MSSIRIDGIYAGIYTTFVGTYDSLILHGASLLDEKSGKVVAVALGDAGWECNTFGEKVIRYPNIRLTCDVPIIACAKILPEGSRWTDYGRSKTFNLSSAHVLRDDKGNIVATLRGITWDIFDNSIDAIFLSPAR